MNTPLRKLRAAFALLFLATASAASGGVIQVGSLSGGYDEIQAAVDAAQPGDLILVRTGTYAGFVVDGKRLSIVADAGAIVQVAGSVVIQNLPASGFVLLSGLNVAVPGSAASSPPGLELLGNAGFVRLSDCEFRGAQGASNASNVSNCSLVGPGSNGVEIAGSARVLFQDCALIGGIGGTAFKKCKGGPGGDGLVTQTSPVALYDCTIRGGTGGRASDTLGDGGKGGTGGTGCRVLDYGIFAGGCDVDGGQGGYGLSGGDGGNGLFVSPAAQAQLLDNFIQPGFGALGEIGEWGDDGLAQLGGGVFNNLPGSARKCSSAHLAPDGGVLEVEVIGEPGDRVWIAMTPAPGFLFVPSLEGVRTYSMPAWLMRAPAGVLPASGTLTLSVPLVDQLPGEPARHRFAQGLVISASGDARLGSPLDVVTLDCASLVPDCNSTGEMDSCEILYGSSVDCDHNGQPDECDPDCNGNAIADACDIGSGSSSDLNHNGVPDECEPQDATWHVDASAFPGGNGSAGAPFRTLAEGFAIALPGDTVLVADGVYSGPENRALDFAGRDFTVRSANGAAACVIDCESVGRAFRLRSGESLAARIQGLTVFRGEGKPTISPGAVGGAIVVENSSVTVADCVFVQCNAINRGGAIYLHQSSAEISRCSFVDNSGGGGGAVGAASFGTTRISDCHFADNTASSGGALFLELGLNPQAEWPVSRCVFLGNVATVEGGALYTRSHTGVSLDQCLIAGNRAVRGSAILSNCNLPVIANSTLVDNLASGTAALHSDQCSQIEILNSIVWNNPSPGGQQVWLDNSPFAVTSVAFSNVQGGQGNVHMGSGVTLNWGAGNIDVDPLFADPDGPDNDPATLFDNDYRLGPLSPAADAGDNASVPLDKFDLDGDLITSEPVPFDLDGHPRFVDDPLVPDTGSGAPPIVDLGPYERSP